MKQKKQLAVLLVLILIAAAVWLWSYRHSNPVGTDDPPLTARKDPVPIENPQIRMDEIEKARKAEYKSSGRNIFSEVAQAAGPSGPKRPQAPAPVPNACGFIGAGPCPPPLPPPPVLPAKFFGYGVVPNGTSRRAFLTDSEGKVYVVSEGEVLMNRFRILKIGNANLEFEEVSSGRIGTAPLEEQAGSPPGGPSG